MQGAMGCGVLGWIQVTPRWDNDHVGRYTDRNGIEGQGGCGYPSPLDGKRAEGGEGWSRLRRVAYITINYGA